jgi:hypothetical protein
MSNNRASPAIRGPGNHNLFDLTRLQKVIVAQEEFVIYLCKSDWLGNALSSRHLGREYAAIADFRINRFFNLE